MKEFSISDSVLYNIVYFFDFVMILLFFDVCRKVIIYLELLIIL